MLGLSLHSLCFTSLCWSRRTKIIGTSVVTPFLEDVLPQALQLIPCNHANKVLVRMEDSLLNKWFAACQVISETVIQVFQELNVETHSRKDVFPQLLKRLGFQDRESEELCRSVDRFYTELFNMHTHGNDTSALSRQAPSMRKRKRE